MAGYPKRITLEVGSWPLFPELEPVADRAVRDGLDPTRVRWIDPRDLHPAALAWRGRALGLGLIVVPQYRSGADVTVARVSKVDAIVELLSDCFNLAVMGDVGLQTLPRRGERRAVLPADARRHADCGRDRARARGAPRYGPMTEIADHEVYVRAPAALWRAVPDALVVLGPKARKPRLITGPAAEVWGLLGQPVAFGRVVGALARAHQASPDVVRRDLQPVLRALRRDGAIDLVP